MSEGHIIARVLLSHELKTAPVLLSHTQGCSGLVELWTPLHSGLMSEGHITARVLLSHELKTAPVLLSHTQGCSGLVESRAPHLSLIHI